MIILGTNSIKDTGFDVANSCRFNSGSSDYLNNTSVASVTNRLKFTISLWVKRSTLGAKSMIGTVGGDSSNFGAIWFDSSDRLNCTEGSGGGTLNFITNRVFRDVSAWYNIILAIDTTQGTESNRVKIYVGGVQETSFSTSTYPSQNSNMHLNRGGKTQYIGRHTDSSNNYYFDGYMTEVVWVDGQQLSNTDLGEFDSDSGIWKPIDVSGLTFGNNGFYLDFEDSSALGNDANGSNNFTVNNLTAIDQSISTCTNIFCTWNPIANYTNSVAFSEGNLVAMSGTNDQWDSGRATMGFSKGKWYFECLFVAGVSTQYIGVVDESCKMNVANAHNENGTTIYYNNGGGEIRKDGSFTSADYGTFSSSEVAGIAIDADNFTISVYKGGSAIVNAYALSTTRTGFLFPMTTLLNNGDGVKVNFGSPPYSESGGNTDANGYGNFNQSVPSGYFAINTKNLAEYG